MYQALLFPPPREARASPYAGKRGTGDEASTWACIGYSTATRAVWVILLEHEGRRPEGESNITHTARKVVV